MKEKYDITLASGIKGAKLKNVAKKKNTRDNSWFYLSTAGQIGYTIAIPLVIGAFAGKVAGHALIGLTIGGIISVVGFFKIIQKLL